MESEAANVIPEVGLQLTGIRPEKPRNSSVAAAGEAAPAELTDENFLESVAMFSAWRKSITGARTARAYAAHLPNRMFAGFRSARVAYPGAGAA